MISLKKQLYILKIQQLFTENSIVLIYQYNHINVQDCYNLKIQVKSIKNLVVKNTLFFKAFESNSKKNLFFLELESQPLISEKINGDKKNIFSINGKQLLKMNFLFQGPILLIACNSLSQLKNSAEFLQNNHKFLFLGAVFKNQIINHLDLKKLLEIDNKVYENFLKIFMQNFQTLNFKNNFNKLLPFLQNLNFSKENDLLFSLNTLKNVHKKK